jgi:tetratricopeptide (TPR) repeat protein
MAAGISRKELKRDVLVEATLGAGEWFERHGRSAIAAAVVLAVAFLGYLGWRWNAERGQARAEASLASGHAAYRAAEAAGFAAEDLERARESFAQAAEAGGSGAAGRLGAYWHAVALHRLGRSAEAAADLEPLYLEAGVPATLAGGAKALAADTLAAAGETERATTLLSELAAADPETYPAELALATLASLRDRAGDRAGARRAWQEILDRFPDRATAARAREALGR